MEPVSQIQREQVSALAKTGYVTVLFIAAALLVLVLVLASGPIFFASLQEWGGLGILWSLCIPAYLFISCKVAYKHSKYFEAETLKKALLSFIGNMLFVAISGSAITITLIKILDYLVKYAT